MHGVLVDPLVGRAVDEELPAARRAQEAGREVDRVTDHRILTPGAHPDLAAIHRPRSHARPIRVAGQTEQLQAAADRTLLVVLMADRCPEEGHQHAPRVACGEVAEVAAVVRDHANCGGQETLQLRHRLSVLDGNRPQSDEQGRDRCVAR